MNEKIEYNKNILGTTNNHTVKINKKKKIKQMVKYGLYKQALKYIKEKKIKKLDNNYSLKLIKYLYDTNEKHYIVNIKRIKN